MKQNSMAGTARHEIKNKSQKQREPAVKEYLQGTGVQPPDTVLHHSREYGIIEVVDKTIHRKFTHIGWMAKIRAIKRKTEKGNKTG